MKRTSLVLTAALTTAFCAIGAAAPTAAVGQGLSLELRGSLQKPVGDFDDLADGNAGYGAAAFFNVSPNLSVYGGWSHESFGCEVSCDGCAAACDTDGFESEGFEGGVKFIVTRMGGVLPWVKGGAVYHQLEVDSGLGDDNDFVSDRSLGFQAAVGADIPLGMVLSFSPALRYQKYTAEFEVLNQVAGAERDVGFLALDLGAHIRLGR